jgi:RNA polymerase sigma-70 factor (ECF subfamily)
MREDPRVANAASSSRAGPAFRERDDSALVDALLAGDEKTFAVLVERWGAVMLRLALVYVASRAVAEEVVQEAWLVVLRDLSRFERRSALRTWVLGIVVNVARSRARAEGRSVTLAPDVDERVVDSSRLQPEGARWPDHWSAPPAPWAVPEEALLAAETREVMLGAIVTLSPVQREVLVLRDLEGLPAEETCNVLGLSDANQRVLLHRARSQGTDRARAVLRRDGADVIENDLSERPAASSWSSSPTTSRPGCRRTIGRASKPIWPSASPAATDDPCAGVRPEESLSVDARDALMAAFGDWARRGDSL